MGFVIALIFVVAMFFAWAIGGEQYFGKGKRGFLLAIPMTLISIGYMAWYWIPVQALALYGIYQALKYDPGIELVYVQKKMIGWLIIGANGALIGLTPGVLLLGGGHVWRILISVLIGVVGFCIVIILANDPKFKGYRDWLTKTMPPKKVYLKYISINLQDAWYVSEGLMGAILGVAVLTLR